MEILSPDFFSRPTLGVARELIGKLLVHEENGHRLVGRIVETEAYREDDPACHAWSEVKRRNSKTAAGWRGEVLMGEPGLAYVYLNYGMYWLLNVVTEPAGVGAAVLFRAVEPIEGIEVMRARRAVRKDRELTSGPGKLTVAFGIDDRHHRQPLTEPPLYLAAEVPPPALRVAVSERIGINRGAELPWRFYVPGNPWVSGKRDRKNLNELNDLKDQKDLKDLKDLE
ncbi:MAG: DNA-3-methyladenine glycosylase [Acidobacteria bacterium]|nr:MAG: DNA-3-methyladenine glycosylase [Acidobacteriota bacterium]